MPRIASTASLRSRLRRSAVAGADRPPFEFALVAPVFIALLFAIIETALVFFAGQVLETVASNSRSPGHDRAGAERGDGPGDVPSEGLRSYPALFTCANVYVDVKSYPGVQQRRHQQPDRRQRHLHPADVLQSGGPGDIVVVRLFYQWPMFVTRLGYNITNLSGSKRLLTATAAFKNEPF